MFTLDKKDVKLVSFNPRIELHGEDPQPAADLYVTANLDSGVLAMFAPELRHFLFHKAGVARDMVDATHEAPDLRFEKLGKLRWDEELVGATVTVGHGLGGRSDLVLEGSKVNKFSIEPMQGGTVVVGFRVQCRPDERQAGKLYLLQGESIEITVSPADVDEPEGDAPLNTAGTESEPARGRRGRKASRTAELV